MKVNTLTQVGQIFTIIAAALWCFTLVGMAWGIPMIIGCSKRLKGEKEVTVAHIVISMIFFMFFGFFGGIFTLIGKVTK